MVTSDDLAKLKIRHVIFHDIPKHIKGATGAPVLADVETEITADRNAMLKKRLIQALGSKTAYEIEFNPDTSSPVPGLVKECTAERQAIKKFIRDSQDLAKHLFEEQNGQNSAGLLCVLDVVSGGRNALAILKLERETGADLQLKKVKGGKQFTLSILDNLVFTDGTRLFKSSLFINTGGGEFSSVVCDSQRSVMASTDMGRFWLKYLGCQVTVEPRISTQRWFDTTIEFLNDHVTDPVVTNDLYEHLQSELKSNKKNISPKKFIEDCFPDNYRNEYKDFLKEKGVLLQAFEKDVSDIKSKITRKLLRTAKGVTVTVPADEDDLVSIEAEQIVVRDPLQTIEKK